MIPYMQGDVQTSVSALLVLGDKANGLISDQSTEQWFASYIGKFKNLTQVASFAYFISGDGYNVVM